MFWQCVLCYVIDNYMLCKQEFFILTYFFFFSGHYNGVSSRQIRAFRHILIFAFNRGAKATEAARDICEVYGEEAMSRRTAQNWFKQLKDFNFDLEDIHHTRYTIQFDEERLNESIHEDPRQTTREVAGIMEYSHSTLEHKLHSIRKVQKLGTCSAWFERQ